MSTRKKLQYSAQDLKLARLMVEAARLAREENGGMGIAGALAVAAYIGLPTRTRTEKDLAREKVYRLSYAAVEICKERYPGFSFVVGSDNTYRMTDELDRYSKGAIMGRARKAATANRRAVMELEPLAKTDNEKMVLELLKGRMVHDEITERLTVMIDATFAVHPAEDVETISA